jgi:hypothetical protein
MMRPTMRSISAARTARLSVDADSRPWLLGFWWCARPNGYAATDSCCRWRGQRGRRVSLHVVVMNRVGVTDGCWIDHISGDKRDSRRANLRVVPPPRERAESDAWHRRAARASRGLERAGRVPARAPHDRDLRHPGTGRRGGHHGPLRPGPLRSDGEQRRGVAGRCRLPHRGRRHQARAPAHLEERRGQRRGEADRGRGGPPAPCREGQQERAVVVSNGARDALYAWLRVRRAVPGLLPRGRRAPRAPFTSHAACNAPASEADSFRRLKPSV